VHVLGADWYERLVLVEDARDDGEDVGEFRVRKARICLEEKLSTFSEPLSYTRPASAMATRRRKKNTRR